MLKHRFFLWQEESSIELIRLSFYLNIKNLRLSECNAQFAMHVKEFSIFESYTVS